MSQYLPTGGFILLSQTHIGKINLGKCTKNSKKCMILEVDLEYPQELHDLHNGYPLAPAKLYVQKYVIELL